MSFRTFLDGRVTLHAGDCREVLATLPEASVDSVVCDPPYGIDFMGKGWDSFGREREYEPRGGCGDKGVLPGYGRGGTSDQRESYRRKANHSFQEWCEEWAREVFRVMKPGAHLLAFSGTRTYHRMVCAIEDAGFEIRDCIFWHYGSGFPKSHDVSKAIDRAAPRLGMFDGFARHYEERRRTADLTHAAVCAAGRFFAEHNHGGASVNWEKGHNVPTLEQWTVLQPLLGLSAEWLPLIERIEAEREVVGQQQQGKLAVAPGQGEDRSAIVLDITAPATEAAKQWEGWGTALKPSTEPIVLARKPLTGNVAENVLRWGTGALNIDGCRVATNDDLNGGTYCGTARGQSPDSTWQNADRSNGMGSGLRRGVGQFVQPLGRWPANLVHDGSPEVMAAFPESDAGQINANLKRHSGNGLNYDGGFAGGQPKVAHGDAGSAARFFYTAKADAHDRIGSKHPTIKPLNLIRWLVKLITPPNGIVLDCFAGTGTTGEASWLEGMRAILIEREDEYCEDIARRMHLAQNPDKRDAVANTKNNINAPVEELPLFGGAR